MLRRFKAHASHDKGTTWSKTRAVGWAINDVKGEDDEFGYVVAVSLDSGDTMIDVEIPLRVLKLLVKDVGKIDPNPKDQTVNQQRPAS